MLETKDTAVLSEDHLQVNGAHWQLSMTCLVLLIRRERRIIGCLTIVGGLLGIIVAFLLPNHYTAITTLMPPQQSRSIASALLSQLGTVSALVSGSGDSAVKDPSDVFVSILQSRSIADALIAEYNLQTVYGKTRPEDLRSALAERTRIRSGKGGVISVAVDDKDATRAANLANSYVSEMYRLNSRLALTEAGQRRIFFEQQYKHANQELLDAEEGFKETQQKTGLVQLDAQAKGLVEGTAALKSKLAAKEVEVRAMQTYATNENPNLKLAEQEVAALREQVAKLDKHRRTGTTDVELSKLPSAAMEYVTKLRNLKYKEGVLEAIGKQLEIARIDEAKDAPMIQVIDPAVPPTKPTGPNRFAIFVSGVTSAFVLAVGFVIMRERLKNHPLGDSRMRAQASEMW